MRDYLITYQILLFLNKADIISECKIKNNNLYHFDNALATDIEVIGEKLFFKFKAIGELTIKSYPV